MASTTACSRCDGPVGPSDLAQGLAVRVQGDLVCPLCIDTLPLEVQEGIARARRARGLSPVLRFYLHPVRRDLRLYAFSDAADLGVHRRALQQGRVLPSVPFLRPRRRPSRLVTVTVTAVGVLGLAGLIAVLSQQPVPSAPAAPPALPPARAPVAPPITPPPSNTPAVVEPPPPAPLPALASDLPPTPPERPKVTIPLPPPVDQPAPTPAPAAVPGPATPAAPDAATAPIPAPPADQEPPLVQAPPRVEILPLETWRPGGSPGRPVTPRSKERPPLPAPRAPYTSGLLAAVEDPGQGPWRGRKTLRLDLPRDEQVRGLVIALHGGRADRKSVEIWSLAGSRPVKIGTLSVQDGWQALSLALPGGGPIVVADSSSITTPFWTAGALAVYGQEPSPILAPLQVVPLQLGQDRRLQELLETANRVRRQKLDPLRLLIGLEDADDSTWKRWQTGVRRELAPRYDGRLPNGLVASIDLLPAQGEVKLPDPDRVHLLVWAPEGGEDLLPRGSWPSRWSALRERLRMREGILVVPVVGRALVAGSVSEAWAPVLADLTRRGDPWIDLRATPADRTDQTLGEAVATLQFHLLWLQARMP